MYSFLVFREGIAIAIVLIYLWLVLYLCGIGRRGYYCV